MTCLCYVAQSVCTITDDCRTVNIPCSDYLYFSSMAWTQTYSFSMLRHNSFHSSGYMCVRMCAVITNHRTMMMAPKATPVEQRATHLTIFLVI